MSKGHCGSVAFASAWSLPAAPDAAAWREALAASGLTVGRARVARMLDDPDPFPIRAIAFEAEPAAPVTLTDPGGHTLSPAALDHALASQALATGRSDIVRTLLAGRAVPPSIRAALLASETQAPLDATLRWPTAPSPGHPLLDAPIRVPTQDLGQPDVATIRALLALPDGRLAAGTDYGLALFDGTAWQPFPYPRGARREGRSVDAMAVHEGVLHVATPKTRYAWTLDAPQTAVHPLPRDDDGGHDDVRSMLASRTGLLMGWRLHLAGAEGLPETLSLTLDPAGHPWGGTRDGRVYVVGHPSTWRRFSAAGKPRPVRYMASAGGCLYVAAAGALHRFDGATWSSRDGESVFLTSDEAGRLWSIRDGRVCVGAGGAWPEPLALPVERPWCLAFAYESLWVGSVGGLLRVPIRSG